MSSAKLQTRLPRDGTGVKARMLRPPEAGMNLHDWATLVSTALLAILALSGLLFAGWVFTTLTALEEGSRKLNNDVGRMSQRLVEPDGGAIVRLEQQVKQLSSRSVELTEAQSLLAADVAALGEAARRIDEKLTELVNQESLRGAQPAPPAPSQPSEIISQPEADGSASAKTQQVDLTAAGSKLETHIFRSASAGVPNG